MIHILDRFTEDTKNVVKRLEDEKTPSEEEHDKQVMKRTSSKEGKFSDFYRLKLFIRSEVSEGNFRQKASKSGLRVQNSPGAFW